MQTMTLSFTGRCICHFQAWRYGAPFRMRNTIRRYRTAFAYARSKQTERQALDMLYDCQETAGTFCLISIDADQVLEAAEEKWGGVLGLDRLCRDAAQRVAQKWNDDGELRNAAEDWALQLVEEYADNEGIKLVELDQVEF